MLMNPRALFVLALAPVVLNCGGSSSVDPDGGGVVDGGLTGDGGGLNEPTGLGARPAHVGIDPEQAAAIPGSVTRRIHVGADGDDGRTIEQASDPTTPWRTIARVNQAMSELGAGDAVLFRRGDVFRDTLVISGSGSQAAPLVFGQYGDSGALPVISAADLVTGFVADGGGVEVAAVDAAVTRVFINGAELPLARSPNTGLFAASDAGQGQIGAPGVGAVDWQGGRVWVRTLAWRRDDADVVGQDGDTLTVGNGLANFEAGAGFLIEGTRGALDEPGEWFYDAGAGQLYVWPPTGVDLATATVEATTRDSAILIGTDASFQDVEVRGLELAKAGGVALFQPDYTSTRLHITHTMIRDAVVGARFNGNSNDLVIDQSEIVGTRDEAVTATGSDGFVLRRNAFYDQSTDPRRGMSYGSGPSTGSRNAIVEDNYLLRAGYNGITMTDALDSVVRRNVVVDAMLTMSDGGAIYTYSDGSARLQVIDNVVVGAPGSGFGVADGYDGAYGIYLDNDTLDPLIQGNLVVDAHNGIFFNAGGSGFRLLDNAVVGRGAGLEFNTGGQEARNNLVVATEPDGYMIRVDIGGITPGELGPFDDNVYHHPFADRMARHAGEDLDFAAWQGIGQDLAGRFDSTAWAADETAADRLTVLGNTSLATVELAVPDGTWVDLRTGDTVGASISLAPFAHAVLERR